ncbi:MAG: ester cyclase [Bacteroidota bacterium]
MRKLMFFAMAVLAAGLFYACGPKPEEKAEVKNNDAEMKARFNALNDCFNTGNTDAIDTLLTADAVDHSEDTSMHLPKGPAGLKELVKFLRTGSPDLKSEIKMMAADGDMLMVYGTTSGTNTGSMMGMPPTNKAWTSDFVDIVKFDSDLKMTEHWGVYDQFKMLSDLGVLCPPPPDAKKKGK